MTFSCLLISSLPVSALRTYIGLLGIPRDSTSIIEALPGKNDIGQCMRFPTIWYVQADQRLCLLLEYFMIVKLLTEHHLEFLSLKGGC